jgi:hypothetical protein
MSTSSIGLLILLGVFGFIIYMSMRTQRTIQNLATYIQKSGFAPAQCALESPFPYTDMSSVDCYSGSLTPAVKASLLLGRRRGTSVLINGVPTAQMEDYIGLHLPAAAAGGALNDKFLALFPADPDSRGPKPLRVIRTPDGGVLFNWRGDHDQGTVAARLDLVRKALP